MEREQLVRVLEQHYRQLLRRALHLLRQRQDAEDAVQSACLRAWIQIDTLHDDRLCLSWLYRIVYNESMAIFRERKNQPYFLPDDQLQYIPCQRNEHARHLEQMQLDSMLLELPEKRRYAMFYRYTMGCNIAETARKMHLSEGTVKSCLFCARRTLRERLEQIGDSFYSA